MARRSDPELDEALELMHFGFRAIIAGPDRVLARRGLGRVHHRILYFTRRNPGISVGDLVNVLGVTKQALHGPLLELERAQLVERTRDPADRRIVRLGLSREGAKLEAQLSGAQREHFARVFREVGPADERGWRAVMQQLRASSGT